MAPTQNSARRSAAYQTPASQTEGRHAPEPARRLAPHLKVFVAPPTAASPKLMLSARLPQIAQQPPPALPLLPSVHQLHLSRREQSVTEVLAPVPGAPAQALPARLSACCPARPLSPTTQPRRAQLTARIQRASVLQLPPLSCPMVRNVDKQEVLATAGQAAAVSVEVTIHPCFSFPFNLAAPIRLVHTFCVEGGHASWVVGVAGCLVAYTVLALVVIWYFLSFCCFDRYFPCRCYCAYCRGGRRS